MDIKDSESNLSTKSSPSTKCPPSIHSTITDNYCIAGNNEGTIVVGLAGPSGSGKTAFSEKVRSFMPGVCVISMDNYNDGSKVIDSNFDDPRLTDYDLLLGNISDLRNNKSIQAPIYDFKKSCRVGYRHVEVPSSRVVILEGIYALTERLRDLLDLRVSIRGGIHFDLVKRVLRDLNRSGQQADTIIQQVSDTVYPMYKAFIEPDLKTAHLKIHNNFNPFSGFICNPIYILKSAKELPTDELLDVLEENKVEETETEMVDIYLLPPNEDPEQCSSWLRMRSREGKYQLMFEEWVTEVPFIISPRISFEVSVRILGGLMALGYEIGPILKRHSLVYTDAKLSIKIDTIEKLGKFVQVQGDNRETVAEAGRKLGLEGHYIPRSYIEQVQLEDLVAALKSGDLTEELVGVVPVDVALTKTISERLDFSQTANITSTSSFSKSRELQSTGSLPSRLNWSYPVQIPGSRSPPHGPVSHSDEGGLQRGLLHAELHRNTQQEGEQGEGGVVGEKMAPQSEIQALVEAVHELVECVREKEEMRWRSEKWMLMVMSGLCCMSGMMMGWILSKRE